MNPPVDADGDFLIGPDYLPAPELTVKAGVPQGKIIGPDVLPSNVYTNTIRTYWVYVPAQYDRAAPAALMVYQDGQSNMREPTAKNWGRTPCTMMIAVRV